MRVRSLVDFPHAEVETAAKNLGLVGERESFGFLLAFEETLLKIKKHHKQGDNDREIVLYIEISNNALIIENAGIEYRHKIDPKLWDRN